MLGLAAAAQGPVALRYPRGGEERYTADAGRAPCTRLTEGADITLVTHGIPVSTVLQVAERLRQAGYSPEVWKLNRLLPLEAEGVLQSAARTGRLLVAEECAEMGCMGGRIAAQLSERGIAMKKVRLCNTGRGYVPQGTVAQLRQWCGLD